MFNTLASNAQEQSSTRCSEYIRAVKILNRATAVINVRAVQLRKIEAWVVLCRSFAVTEVKRSVDLGQIMPQYIPQLKINLVPSCGFVILGDPRGTSRDDAIFLDFRPKISHRPS